MGAIHHQKEGGEIKDRLLLFIHSKLPCLASKLSLVKQGWPQLLSSQLVIKEGEIIRWRKGHITAACAQCLPSSLVSCKRQVTVPEEFPLFTSENLTGHLHSISETPP